MRLIRLVDLTLYEVVKGTKPDGDPCEDYNLVDTYQGELQYLDDSVAAQMYGADVTKTYRINSIRNELEKYLLPKINNSADNLSNYLVAYEGNKFALKRVTPKYIDISWR